MNSAMVFKCDNYKLRWWYCYLWVCDLLFSTRRCFREKTPLTCWLWSFSESERTNTSTPVNEQKSTNTGQVSAWQKPGETHKRPSKEIHIQSTDVEHATMVTFTACVAHRLSITVMMHHSRNLISYQMLAYLSVSSRIVHYSGDALHVCSHPPLLRGLFGVM